MGRVIVVTSGKGGTGKSSVTAALGTALAKRGKKVILLDCDWGLRCLDLILGISVNIVYDMGDVLAASCDISKAIYKVHGAKGLYLIPAPQNSNAKQFADRFKELCFILSNNFDYVLIDSPAGIENGFKTAVTYAEMALVVATPDAVCIRDAERVGRLLEENGITDYRLIINKITRSIFKYDETRNFDKIIDGISMQLIALIPNDKEVSAFAGMGIPLYEKGKAAEAIKRLAARIDGEEVPLPKRI